MNALSTKSLPKSSNIISMHILSVLHIYYTFCMKLKNKNFEISVYKKYISNIKTIKTPLCKGVIDKW